MTGSKSGVSSLEYGLPDVQKQGDLIYLTYFNAGLRIFDIQDAHLPREVEWFIPPTPVKRLGPQPVTKLVTQTEDVLVDTRGSIYVTDKQWGLFVLRNAGKGQPEPAAKQHRRALRRTRRNSARASRRLR